MVRYKSLPGSLLLLFVGSKSCKGLLMPCGGHRMQGAIHKTHGCRKMTTSLDMAAIGIFFGTSTGNTQNAADKIFEAFGPDVASEPIDVDALDKGQLSKVFSEHDALVVGTPTWNTGADTERSGTGWDELYYGPLPDIQDSLSGKKVAVFGLGDQVSYAENYADATGELYDVFEGLGCQMLGSWGQDGYEHESSKALRGNKFCGLVLDEVNQEGLTDERVAKWVSQLLSEGILEGAGETAGASCSNTAVQVVDKVGATLEQEDDQLTTELSESSELLDDQIRAHSGGGFIPHYNPVSKSTMWTSPDGRKSYLTTDTTNSKFSP